LLGWLIGSLERENHSSGGGGSGGRPRIRFGNTGPRGRQYAKTTTSKTQTCVVKAKYVRASSDSSRHISAHVRYIEEREKGEKERDRDFFDRDRNGIERNEVERAMLENQGDRTAMHKLILSPGDNEVDIREYTRDSLGALEGRLGHKLDWYAVIHQNTDHHHAHVVIAGKVPGHEREVERNEAKESDREGKERGDREPSWKNQERDMKELLGDRYDEKAVTDPREDRQAERSLWSEKGEREPIDPTLRDLLDDNMRSPAELRTERMLDKYEREMALRESAHDRGDVYLDRHDLKELRSAGNDYIHRERSLEYSLEHAYEREFGREFSRELERGDERSRELDFQQSQWTDISRMFDQGQEPEREPEPSHERGTSRERGADEEREPEREKDDFDRGR
jgi:hypothetical protein